MKEYVLKSKLSPFDRDGDIDKIYRGVLSRPSWSRGHLLFTIEQPIDGKWHATGGGWRLETLLENRTDGLLIDAGQRWGVKGMRKALREAEGFDSSKIASVKLASEILKVAKELVGANFESIYKSNEWLNQYDLSVYDTESGSASVMEDLLSDAQGMGTSLGTKDLKEITESIVALGNKYTVLGRKYSNDIKDLQEELYRLENYDVIVDKFVKSLKSKVGGRVGRNVSGYDIRIPLKTKYGEVIYGISLNSHIGSRNNISGSAELRRDNPYISSLVDKVGLSPLSKIRKDDAFRHITNYNDLNKIVGLINRSMKDSVNSFNKLGAV